MIRQSPTPLDRIILEVDAALQTLFSVPKASRVNPGDDQPDIVLSDAAQRDSAGFMRVDHTGEVCAQALYRGQLSVVRSKSVRALLTQACQEELDHLAWTRQRLRELEARPSLLNVFWYTGSFLIGLMAGVAGDEWSLGFVEETERQVAEHLAHHMKSLPEADLKSHAIVSKMQEDEMHHGQTAQEAGGRSLPVILQTIMALQSKVMTTLAYHL